MKKQEILEQLNKKLKIENYSEQTIENYLSAQQFCYISFRRRTDI